MRLKIRQPVKDSLNNCIICRGKKNLLEFYDIDDDALNFCVCKYCADALYDTCIDNYMFETSKMASNDANYQSYKTGYREGYRDGFRDNYESHD